MQYFIIVWMCLICFVMNKSVDKKEESKVVYRHNLSEKQLKRYGEYLEKITIKNGNVYLYDSNCIIMQKGIKIDFPEPLEIENNNIDIYVKSNKREFNYNIKVDSNRIYRIVITMDKITVY